MRRVFWIAAVVIAALGLGCEGPKTPERKKADAAEVETKLLPKGGKVIEVLENDWYLVEINGKRYMYYKRYLNDSRSAPVIIEVKE